jgi:hypothetical protein
MVLTAKPADEYKLQSFLLKKFSNVLVIDCISIQFNRNVQLGDQELATARNA